MTLLFTPPDEVRLETERLLLAQPGPEAAPRVVAFHRDNAAHLAPYDPPRPPGWLSEDETEARLARARDDLAADRALRLHLFDRRLGERGPVLGVCNFSQIYRGPLQSCILGYALAAGAVGKGYMTEALGAAIDFVFGPLDLHRIEANYHPLNVRSGNVLRRLGFAVEGYSRDYLFVGGAWQDHVRAALTNPAWRGLTRSSSG